MICVPSTARLEADSAVYYFATWLNNGKIEMQLGREGDIPMNDQGREKTEVLGKGGDARGARATFPGGVGLRILAL